jgi:hypothetical protein
MQASTSSDMLDSSSLTGSVILQSSGNRRSGMLTDMARANQPSQFTGATTGSLLQHQTMVYDVPSTEQPYSFSQHVYEDDADSLSGMSSLAPLPVVPHSPFTLQQPPTAAGTAGLRDASQHMPGIREDSAEHELDTSDAPSTSARK